MALATVTWDPRDLTTTWGEIELDGFGPDSIVSFTYDEDMCTKTVGAGGFVTVTINANDGGMVTVTLAQGSPVNDKLSAIAALQRRPGAGLIKKPLMIKHNNGTTLIFGAEAWIKKVPDAGFAKEAGTREWPFDIAHAEAFVGGSSR